MRRKLPKKYAGIILGALVPITMGIVMSFIITALNLGFSSNFLQKWGQAYLGALVFGLPLGLIVTPFLKKFVDHITK